MEPIDNYATDSAMDQSYRAQQAQLDTAKKNAQQSAAVSYDLLKKYLPLQNQMNGLSGLGVSDSALIEANNNYVAQQGQIAQTHAADSAALLENYRAEQTASQDTAYNEAYAVISNGMYHTFEELDNYLAEVKDDVSPEQYARLEHLANYAKNDTAEQDRVKLYEEEHKYDDIADHSIKTGAYFSVGKVQAGKTISVQAFNQNNNDKETLRKFLGIEPDTLNYRIKIAGEETDESVLAAAKKYGKNTAFIYGGDIYLNRQGKVYLLQRGKKDYDHLYSYLEKYQK